MRNRLIIYPNYCAKNPELQKIDVNSITESDYINNIFVTIKYFRAYDKINEL